MYRNICLTLSMILTSTFVTARGEDSMLTELTLHGIAMTDSVVLKLAPPTLIGSLSRSERDDLAGNFGWDRFSKDSVVAPIWIDLDYIQDEGGKRVGHSIHFRFVVHERLDRLRDRNIMTSLFGSPASDASDTGAFVELTPTEMATHGIPTSANTYSGFAAVPLMNRVLLRGVIAGQTIDIDQGVVLTWRLVDSIEPGDEYAARWSPLTRDSLGNQVEGEPQPYRGAGGYLHLQSLESIEDSLNSACLVEAKILLHEPQLWFGSSNFLRSKFPLMIQEAVRKMRRTLAAES
ncbi:hypothetical protein Poly41_14580 [Novipirellula artificiosorum]|uniref:Secreted protein n=2 Tax=Novipirellula artificiosorum TaxID=2528016 RepID=A0A5C6DWP5_9BACT|nr:hypothetical protein Poly41_14580 [Novipirellula artificiosorum]